MFVVVSKKKVIYSILSLALVVALLVSVSAGGFASVYFGSASRLIPIYAVETEKPEVAITFDAAYGSDKTEGIMEIMKEYGAEGTFFLVGFWVENFPEKTKAIAENGFEIGTHSNTHPHMSRLSESQINQELTISMNIIEETAGVRPTIFRAPFGEYNDKVISEASKLKLSTIQWDVDSLDWKNVTTEDITNRVLSRVKNGSIILFHNNSDHILDALPIVLSTLKERGYTFKKVSDIIHTENYYIDNNGVQHEQVKNG